jgi:hypothetical protein
MALLGGISWDGNSPLLELANNFLKKHRIHSPSKERRENNVLAVGLMELEATVHASVSCLAAKLKDLFEHIPVCFAEADRGLRALLIPKVS